MDDEQRRLLWLQFTQIYSQNKLYQNLAELQLPPATQFIIQNDVKRTHYNKEYKDQQQKQKLTLMLRNSIKQSLSRFALYNPYLLYCQGMNQIFGFLHQQGFSSKQIFFIFKRITQVLLPSDYYSSLDGIISYLKILWQMITVQFPDIHNKLNHLVKQMSMTGSHLVVLSPVLHWFVSLFSHSKLNRQVRKIIMDYFLLEGITVLFKASLAIFQSLRQTISKVKSFESYMSNVQKAIQKFDDIQNLKKFLNSKFISKQILFLLKQYSTMPKQQSAKKDMSYTKKCSRKWNFCLQKLQNNTNSQFKYDYFVFKRKQNIKLIPDYLSKINNYYFQKKRRTKEIDITRIGRISHICSAPSQTCTEDSLSQTTTKKESPFMSRYSPSPAKKYIGQSKIQIQVKKQTQKNISDGSMHPKLNEFNEKQDNFHEPNYQKQSDAISQSMFAVNNDDVYQNQLDYKQMVKRKLIQQAQKKSMQKSESMMFMKMMVTNQSYSNLLNLLQMDKMFDIDSNSDDQYQSSSAYSPTYSNKTLK